MKDKLKEFQDKLDAKFAELTEANNKEIETTILAPYKDLLISLLNDYEEQVEIYPELYDNFSKDSRIVEVTNYYSDACEFRIITPDGKEHIHSLPWDYMRDRDKYIRQRRKDVEKEIECLEETINEYQERIKVQQDRLRKVKNQLKNNYANNQTKKTKC